MKPAVLPFPTAKLPARGSKRSFMFDRGIKSTGVHHFHRGLDFPAPRGTPVHATAPGRVTHALRQWRQGFTGYGRCVVIEHPGGTWTLSAHLQTVAVEAGDQVEAGQVIGTVGGSQFTKAGRYVDENLGPHLHFEVATRPYPMPSEAERVDPERWLQGTLEGERVAVAAEHSDSGAVVAFTLGVAAYLALRGRGA